MHPDRGSDSIDNIKTIFQEIKEKGRAEELSKDILPELRRALEIEKKGRDFYKEQIGNMDTEEGKKLFKLLSRQEDYHYMTIENLILKLC